MSRVVNPDDTGKRRNQSMRSCAEMLQHLAKKSEMDDEAKDMLATIVFELRDIENGLEESAEVWEKRDYWVKAEQLRQKWSWVGMSADQLDALLRQEAWDKIPAVMVKLLPNFAEVKVTKLTRTKELWEGKYQQFVDERSK